MNDRKENLRNDSLVEIALREMSKKKKPVTLESLYKRIFKEYGIEENTETVSQFQIDFMLSGYFINCGENSKGQKIWNLKNREKSDLLDKEGDRIEDAEEETEVKENELHDENDYILDNPGEYQDDNEDEDDNNNEEDDIATEIDSSGLGNGGEEVEKSYQIDEGEDDTEDSYDDED